MKLYNKLLLFFLLMPFALSAQKPFLDKYERIYSLSEIWKELDYNFAFPDKSKEANLDSLSGVFAEGGKRGGCVYLLSGAFFVYGGDE